MILVLGSILAKEARFTEALALSEEHVARSRQEPGCVSHAVHRDCENPLRLVFVEQWTDQATLLAHFQRPESRVFARALAEVAAAPPNLSVFMATELPLPGKGAA